MPDATFYEEVCDEKTRYVCTIPYTTQPGGICGHWSSDFSLFRQHMEQQHQGILVQGEPPAPSHPETPPPGAPSHPETPPPGAPSHPDVPPPGAPSHPVEEPDEPEAPSHPIEEPDPEAPSHQPGPPPAPAPVGA